MQRVFLRYGLPQPFEIFSLIARLQGFYTGNDRPRREFHNIELGLSDRAPEAPRRSHIDCQGRQGSWWLNRYQQHDIRKPFFI